MTATRQAWTEPKVLLQIVAWLVGFGVLAAQVRANSEQIKATAVVVKEIQDRQAAMEAWKTGHEVSEANEPVRIRDEVRRMDAERRTR